MAALLVVLALAAGAIVPARPFGLFDGENQPSGHLVGAPTFVPQEESTPTTPAVYRGDAARTGTMPGPGPVGAPTLAWKNDEGVYYSNTPVVAGNRVFVARGILDDSSNVLAALDLQTGVELWTAPLVDPSRYVPAVASGLVLLPVENDLVAFDEDTGARAWTYPIDGYFNGVSPAVANGRVYFTVNDFTLRAVDAATGEEAWRIRVPGLTEEEAQSDEGFHIDASVAVADDTVYAVGSDGVVFAAGTTDGDVKWTFQPNGNPQNAPPLVIDGILLVTSIVREQGADGTPGRLYALDAETGSPLWEPKLLSSAASLTAADGSVFV